MELGLQAAHTVVSRVTGSDTEVDAFLEGIPGARRLRGTKRNLLPWRTGIIPGKPQACQECNTGALTTGDRVVKCSGMATSLTEYMQGTLLEGASVIGGSS